MSGLKQLIHFSEINRNRQDLNLILINLSLILAMKLFRTSLTNNRVNQSVRSLIFDSTLLFQHYSFKAHLHNEMTRTKFRLPLTHLLIKNNPIKLEETIT